MVLLCQINISSVCLLIEAARKTIVWDGVEFEHLTEQEQKIVLLDNVRDVLFQALLFDNVSMEKNHIRADMCTVMLLE